DLAALTASAACRARSSITPSSYLCEPNSSTAPMTASMATAPTSGRQNCRRRISNLGIVCSVVQIAGHPPSPAPTECRPGGQLGVEREPCGVETRQHIGHGHRPQRFHGFVPNDSVVRHTDGTLQEADGVANTMVDRSIEHLERNGA